MHAEPRGRVLFIGAVHEAAPAFATLLDADVDLVGLITAPSGRAASMSGYVDLHRLAARRAIPVLATTDANSEAALRWVAAHRPDLIVVVGWSRLLREPLLALPSRGCVGFHASLLPHGRGRAPVNWAIIRGETQTGNTMMYLVPGVDAGDIIDQAAVPIGPDDTCETVYAAVARAGSVMLRRHLAGLLAGTAPRRPQVHDHADYLPKRTPDMGITDWRRPSVAVHDWIRAQTSPYPGAFGYLQGRKVMLWHSASPDGSGGAARAGTVLSISPGGVRVATADGSLLLTHVGDHGGPVTPAGEWFARAGLRPGTVFDEVDPEQSRRVLGLHDTAGMGA